LEAPRLPRRLHRPRLRPHRVSTCSQLLLRRLLPRLLPRLLL
jgi:hypothetical protein